MMKYKLEFDIAWYKSNNFALLVIEIAEHYDYWWTLFRLQIAKFEFCIMLTKKESSEER